MKCDKCGKDVIMTQVSYLSEQTLCSACMEEERKLPFYDFGRRIEAQHVKDGDYNFPGVLNGLLYHTPAEANVLVRIKYRDTDENIYKAWDALINNMSFDPSSFATLMKQNGIRYMDEAKSWISYMATTSNIDGRNEAAQAECQKVGGKELGAPPTVLTRQMSKNHRTLQQTFTGVMLAYYTGENYNLALI